MKVLMTGGGSGGHITPLLAVASEVKHLQPDAVITYIGQRHDKVAGSVAGHTAISRTHTIFAGKLRRYHGEGWRQLLDVKTLFFNIRDVFYTAIGIVQSVWLVGIERPDVLFIKGGYVGVPVGLAAALWRVRFVTHDSDAVPGLANRIVGRWAKVHAVGLPEELYAYPRATTKTVGVPIAQEYKRVMAEQQVRYKRELGFQADTRIVLVTGGGLGAQSINEAVVAMAPTLLARFPNLAIIHLTGHKKFRNIMDCYDQIDPAIRTRIMVKDFVTDLYRYSAAADIVVTRAGATSVAEFAMQGKACIIIPNPILAGGHQSKNAEAYRDAAAAMIVAEADVPTLLEPAITALLDDPVTIQKLGEALHTFANPHAARDLANLVLAQAQSANPRRER